MPRFKRKKERLLARFGCQDEDDVAEAGQRRLLGCIESGDDNDIKNIEG